MLIIGATGPVDAARRRPWIDWIHTSADQGALIRPYSKWDDQPASVEAALDSLARAYEITREAPSAPVYVCLDVSLQEQPLPEPPAIPDVARDRSPRSHGPGRRRGRGHAGPARRRPPPPVPARPPQPRRTGLGPPGRASGTVRRARHLRPQERRGLPAGHPLHPDPPGIFLPATSAELIGAADLIISLDWVDLAGTLAAAEPTAIRPRPRSSRARPTPPCTTAGPRIPSAASRLTWASPPIRTCWSVRCSNRTSP